MLLEEDLMSIYRMSINTNTKPKRKKTRGGNLVLFYTIASLDPFPVMQGFGGFSVHGITFPHFRYFFFSMALFPFNQNKKKKEKDSNRHYYGCGREVVYASEWFFLFKAMMDDKNRLSLVATK